MQKIGAIYIVVFLLIIGAVSAQSVQDDFDGPPTQEQIDEFIDSREEFRDQALEQVGVNSVVEEPARGAREQRDTGRSDLDTFIERLPESVREVAKREAAAFKEERDEQGCLSASLLQQKTQACEARGGTPVDKELPNSCIQVECSFKREDADFFSAKPDCPDVRAVQNECRELGLRTIMNKDRGCLYAKCATPDLDPEELCSEADPVYKQRIVAKCIADGGEPRTNFEDSTGCPKTRCSFNEEDKEDACQRDVPDSAYVRCEEEGGELIVKYDDLQCVSFQKCIKRGNENAIEVTEEEVGNAGELDVTDLLSVTLKLEALATKLNDLAKKADEIAAYHSNEKNAVSEKRFAKAAGMFAAAQKRIDSIKSMIASAAEDNAVSESEILAIKHDIKYIKEVVLNNILFVMLGESELSGEFEGGDDLSVDCGEDEECFEDRLKVCAPALFHPDKQVIVTITGLGKKGCLFEAEGDTPFGGKSMKCEYPDYAFGFERPQDFIPYCKGSMVKMLEEEIDSEFEDDFRDEGPPKICLENDIFDPKECFELTVEKYGLPPFCDGLSADECFEKELAPRIEKDMPPECRERGLVGFECAKFMFSEFGLPFQCEEAGLNEKQCMRAIMSGEIDPEAGGFEGGENFGPRECEGLPRDECETLMAKKHGAPDECFDDGRFIGRYECEEKMMSQGHKGGLGQGGPGYGGDPFQMCKEAGITDLQGCEDLMRERGRFGPGSDEKFRETKERERECARSCEERGEAWDFSGGECRCRGHNGKRGDFDNYRDDDRHDEDRNMKEIQRKKEELRRHYEELFSDPSIPNEEKERLRREMEEEMRQFEGEFGGRSGPSPGPSSNFNRDCPDIQIDIRNCEANGGRWHQESTGQCPHVVCEQAYDNRQCPDFDSVRPPQCDGAPLEVGRDGNGCEYYYCGERDHDDVSDEPHDDVEEHHEDNFEEDDSQDGHDEGSSGDGQDENSGSSGDGQDKNSGSNGDDGKSDGQSAETSDSRNSGGEASDSGSGGEVTGEAVRGITGWIIKRWS